MTKAAITGTLGILALGAVSASAMGFGGAGMGTVSADELATRHATMFQQQANLIGATVDEVKQAWADGKDFKTLAKEKGITEEQLQAKMKSAREEQMKAHLATLVSKGVITQAQADKRLATITTKKTSGYNAKRHGSREGFMGGMGF
jgi:hypothetical protein